MLPNFVYIIYRCYVTMLDFHWGVTSSAYGVYISLKWANVLARLGFFWLEGRSCGASTFVGMLLMTYLVVVYAHRGVVCSLLGSKPVRISFEMPISSLCCYIYHV
jgi:hypothetical protein